MKRHLLKSLSMAMTAFVLLFAPNYAAAEILITENFKYTTGDLYGHGGWVRFGSQSNGAIQVLGESLTYGGYRSEPIGGSASLSYGTNSADQDLHRPFNNDKTVTSGSVYYAALINVQEVNGSNMVLSFDGRTASSAIADGKSTTNNARLFLMTSTNEGKFKLGISKNGSSGNPSTEAEYNYNETYLVVLKYTFVEEASNDEIALFVNPTSDSEPAALISTTSGSDFTAVVNGKDNDFGIGGITLLQYGNDNRPCPKFTIDAIRVATTWAEIFDSTEEEAEPETGGGDNGDNGQTGGDNGETGQTGGGEGSGEAGNGGSEGGDSQETTATPELTVTNTFTYSGDALPINVATVVKEYDVVAANLTANVDVYLTGPNRTMYSVNCEYIDKSATTAHVVVTYTPTAVGKHIGRINFESTPTELNTGENFTYYAYDPNNLPSITLSANELPEFSAAPGEKQQQQITITTSGLPDYGTIKVAGTGNGTFLIGSTMLLKSGTATLNITFQPKSEGDYTETIEFSGVKAETVYLTVSGKCRGTSAQEDKQGDELVLTNDAPVKLLNESFDSVERNQPFSLSGWKNVAVEGTRAWWGYTFDDENKAAKVTAYDSKIEAGDGNECQMLLVTPGLDFVNADSRILTFRIMGQNLREEQDELFEVCYLDVEEDNDIYIEPFQGMSVPSTSDDNDTWTDYVVDLEGQNFPDVFFIGFRYTGSRGVDSSAIYYVDDVTYGRTDVPLIRVSADELTLETEAGSPATQTVTVTGVSLSDVIKVSISSETSDYFSVDKTQLAATGEDLAITFDGDTEGNYMAYVALSSTGAPTKYIAVYAVVSESGVSVILSDKEGKFNVYGLNGVKMISTADAHDLQSLAPGFYIINGKKVCIK